MIALLAGESANSGVPIPAALISVDSLVCHARNPASGDVSTLNATYTARTSVTDLRVTNLARRTCSADTPVLGSVGSLAHPCVECVIERR
ncbi:unnamed protein product [Timema podura]|uniref:Uncharacterized protein n=1 Tax=Timema podura TaxID=61482 RepID=A0ABN7PLX7_TIMPD|nr:unnamed protein product [Timema podura]